MTPKDKAIELVDKFYQAQIKILAKNGTFPIDLVEHEIAKQSALIAVEEVLKSSPILPSPIPCSDYDSCNDQATIFWQKVKQEIENL